MQYWTARPILPDPVCVLPLSTDQKYLLPQWPCSAASSISGLWFPLLVLAFFSLFL